MKNRLNVRPKVNDLPSQYTILNQSERFEWKSSINEIYDTQKNYKINNTKWNKVIRIQNKSNRQRKISL